MSIYTSQVSKLSAGDLQELLQERAVENVRLEFKREVPNKDETLKKLSSFANTFGGFMVIGAAANSDDGRIEDIPGVDEQSGFKQKVVQWCFDGASPPLIVEISDPIPISSGPQKVCYVVSIAESEVAPHFLNGRRGVWIRTDEFSSRFEAQLADESELRHLLDRRKLILERRVNLLDRAKRRFGTFASRTQASGSENKARPGSHLELCIVPRFPAYPLCDQSKLAPMIKSNMVPWRGVLFPRLDHTTIVSQYESALVLLAGRNLSLFELNVWGMVYYGTRIDGDHNGVSGIHLYEFVGTLLVFINHAGKMFKALGYQGEILIEATLTSILGAPWLDVQHGMWLAPRSGSELDDEVVFTISTKSEELIENPDSVVTDLLRYALYSVNAPDLVMTPQRLEELIRHGYKYNSW